MYLRKQKVRGEWGRDRSGGRGIAGG
jgi:hypothetical protein